MATLENTVAIIFEGVDRMGAGVDSAVNKVDSLSSAVEEATQPLASMTTGILKFEGALVASGAAVTAFAVKLAGDLDSQFREIATLIDQPIESLDEFKQSIKDYATDSTQSLDTINQSVYNAISAGVDYTDSLEAVRQAEMLAVGGKATLDQSLTVLVSSLNAYGVGMEDAEKFSDLLFQTVKSGQTTLPELGSSLANVTGLAATAGVSFEELLAGVATLTATGSGTSEAITQIRGAISTLLKPTADATALAEELGIEFDAQALKSKGLAGVLTDVQEATGGNTEQMARLFGSVEALNGVLTLTGLGADKFAQNIEAMGDSAGATEAAYRKMADSIGNGSQRIQNAMQVALIGVGEPLLDEFGGIQDAIAAIFNAIGASVDDGQLQGFVDELEGMFEGIQQTLNDVANNLPAALEQADFSAFFDGIDRIGEAVNEIFNGADLSTVEGLVTAIETLGAGFELLASFTAGTAEAIGPFLQTIVDLGQWISELNPEFLKWVGLVGGLATAVNVVAGPLSGLVKVIGAMAGSEGVVATALPLLTRLVGLFTGPLGIAVAATTAIPVIDDLVSSLFGLQTRAEQIAINDAALAEATTGIDATVESFAQLNEMIESGAVKWDYAAGQWVDGAKDVQTQAEFAAEQMRKNQEDLDVIPNRLREIYDKMRENSAALSDNADQWQTNTEGVRAWNIAVDDAFKQTDEYSRSIIENSRALLDQAAAADKSAGSWRQVSDGVYEQRDAFENVNDVLLEYRDQLQTGLITQEQFDAIEKYAGSIREGSASASEAIDGVADSAGKSEEAIRENTQAANDYKLKMEEIASDERIKTIESTVSLNIAQLEADTERAKALFASIDNTVTSTGDLLGSLFGTLTDAGTFREQFAIEDQIKKENERREEALTLQKDLTAAQVENLRAKTDALRSGGGLVQISSDGLEPALEMIMWQIIEKVQLRANADGAEFLLGI